MKLPRNIFWYYSCTNSVLLTLLGSTIIKFTKLTFFDPAKGRIWPNGVR